MTLKSWPKNNGRSSMLLKRSTKTPKSLKQKTPQMIQQPTTLSPAKRLNSGANWSLKWNQSEKCGRLKDLMLLSWPLNTSLLLPLLVFGLLFLLFYDYLDLFVNFNA